LGLTLLEAALRGGDTALARALAAERLAAKPESPLALRFAARQRRAAGDMARAAAADRAADSLAGAVRQAAAMNAAA
jgi:hypothetical protein